MLQKSFLSFDEFHINYVKQQGKHNMPVQHYHDTYEFYLQTFGERYIFLDDICYTLKKGDLIIFKPFDLHYAESREVDYYERYVMNFHQQKLACLLSDNEIRILFDKLDSGVIHLNDEQFENIYNHYKKAEFYSNKTGFLSEKLLYSTVFQMIMMISEITEKAEKVSEQDVKPEIVKAILYMNKHFGETIELNMLSNLVGMSKYHFSRLFHNTTGATFLEYLYNVRLTKVHRMLIETNLTLNEIADKTGFSSTAHLSRTFRKAYHISPREFRKSSKVSK